MFIFALTYLLAPVFLILFTFFSIPFVLMSAVALVVLVFCLHKSHNMEHADHFSTRIISDYWPLLIIAAVISYLCLVSPFEIWDWEKHYAVFESLQRDSYPPIFEIDGKMWLLRYYIAWYMVPAMLAKVFGSQLLTISMIIWTAIGVFITLFLAFQKIQKTSHLFLVASVFFLFSGLDIVGVFYLNYIEEITPHWLQWWGTGGYIGSYLFNLALLPQHTLGMCLATCLFLYNRPLAIRYGAVIIVVTQMWSLFSVIGLLPIAVWALLREGYRSAFTLQNLLVAPLLAIPIGIYLMQGGEHVPFMFVWQWKDFNLNHYILFVTSEIILILIIMLYINKNDRNLIVIAGSFILFLCLFRGGQFGEFLSRSAVPIMCVLSIFAGMALLENKGLRKEVLVVYLLIGAFPVVVAFVKSITPSTPRANKNMTFEELTRIYTWEDHPYVTYPCLVRRDKVLHIFDIPLMRGLPYKN